MDTVYHTSITKNSIVAAKAAYKVQNGLLACPVGVNVDQCISCVFFFITVL